MNDIVPSSWKNNNYLVLITKKKYNHTYHTSKTTQTHWIVRNKMLTFKSTHIKFKSLMTHHYDLSKGRPYGGIKKCMFCQFNYILCLQLECECVFSIFITFIFLKVKLHLNEKPLVASIVIMSGRYKIRWEKNFQEGKEDGVICKFVKGSTDFFPVLL